MRITVKNTHTQKFDAKGKFVGGDGGDEKFHRLGELLPSLDSCQHTLAAVRTVRHDPRKKEARATKTRHAICFNWVSRHIDAKRSRPFVALGA